MEHAKRSRRRKGPFLPVRWLVIFGISVILLGVCSYLHASHSLSPDLYKLLAAALIIAGLGTLIGIPRQRRAIREAQKAIEDEQV
jgi:hypothetical protein